LEEKKPGKEPPKLGVIALIISPILYLTAGYIAGHYMTLRKLNAAGTIAAVNSEVVTKEQLFSIMEAKDGVAAVRKLVQNDLQTQFAEKMGVLPTPDEAHARFQLLKSYPNYDLILRSSRMTESDFEANVPISMSIEALYTKGITVNSDDELKYYQSESNPRNPVAIFYRPEVIDVSAIRGATEQQVADAEAQVNGGQDFAAVASQVSLDASRANGGQLGPIEYGRSILTSTPNIERAVFSLKAGQMTDPLHWRGTWWVFKCDENTPAQTYPYSVVADQVLRGAMIAKGFLQNGPEVKQEYLAFVRSSNLQAFWPKYNAAVTEQ
jgi:hypothetical protein